MSDDCNKKNSLKRSGVNQYQRVLKALLPDFVKLDERKNVDLILFAKNYASFLKYYDKSNSADGDWAPFMTMDVSVTLASLININIREFYSYTKDIFDEIQSLDVAQTANLKKYYKTLFDLGFSISRILDSYYQAIPNEFGFKEVMRNMIHSALPEYYDRLKKYYDESVNQNLLDPAGTFQHIDCPNDLILSQDFDETSLSDIWIDPTIPLFVPTFNGTTIALKIKNTASHNLFTGIFDRYLKVLSGVIKSASDFLDLTLSNFPSHSPHYALYLVFIKLFRFAQDHQNEFTARHLNLYYKEILRLVKKDAEADQVHLTFELAKTAPDSYLVEKDTVFKAGKDADGQEIYYALKDDAVLGKATVKELKNIFVNKDLTLSENQVLASPVANSEDGQGEELQSADKSWKTFGEAGRVAGEVGFALASSYLYLKEGTRKITFKIYAPAGEYITFSEETVNDSFSLKLTAEKDWLDVPIQTGNVTIDTAKEFFSIIVTLDSGDPSIIPYSKDTHGYNFNRNLPMALFILKDAKAKKALWDFKFEKIGIDLDVSGLKDLVIENDEGVLNPAKPFNLFGSSPYVGSSFLVSSKELFMKAVKPSDDIHVKLSLTWDNYADLIGKISVYDNNYNVNIDYLEDAVWKNAASGEILMDTTGRNFSSSPVEQSGNSGLSAMELFMVNESEIDFESAPPDFEANPVLLDFELHYLTQFATGSEINFDLPQIAVAQDYSDNENYSPRSKWGYFKLILNSPDFGHSSYAKRLADAAKGAIITSSTAGNTTTTSISIEDIPEPYTPKVKELSLAYAVSTEFNFLSEEDDKVFLLCPFGYKEYSEQDLPATLLPESGNEGELFIGLEKLQPGQTLPILFQVAEGTADPLSEAQQVQWYYLAENNKWTLFDKEDISDNTSGLIKSGIIKFSIPDDISDDNTLLGEGLFWLRATVVEKTRAICNLIEIRAQAAVAQFFDYKNTSNYFKSILPAQSISKLVFSESAIKKIEQPYASFGGRAKEEDDSFYCRVSERLRHKDRAVSMWDYERLVLEEFPEIYKVKCINHTQIIEITSGTQVRYADNELKPGHVLVVPIPDLHSRNAYDPMRPYTSLGLLDDIKEYLFGKISPHVNLDVRNPRFEEIQLEFSVQYLTDDKELYTQMLKQELEEYLAPWAFDEKTDIEFGGKISKSVLINFIEERSYVDYLSCVKMYRIVDGVKSNDLEEVYATSARSVFVSVKSDDPVNSHIINETACIC